MQQQQAAVDGAEIRRRREAAGIKPGNFAARLGIDHSWLWRIEHGKRDPSPELLARIAAVLECPQSELMTGAAAERQ